MHFWTFFFGGCNSANGFWKRTKLGLIVPAHKKKLLRPWEMRKLQWHWMALQNLFFYWKIQNIHTWFDSAPIFFWRMEMLDTYGQVIRGGELLQTLDLNQCFEKSKCPFSTLFRSYGTPNKSPITTKINKEVEHYATCVAGSTGKLTMCKST